MSVDTATGEVRDDEQTDIALVPLHIAELDENELLALFPTPVQCAGALLIARERIANAPGALERLSGQVRAAKRALIVERAKARIRFRREGWNVGDSKDLAESDDVVKAAVEAVDDAELALEYGRDLRRTLETEIEILRSLNANMRREHGNG